MASAWPGQHPPGLAPRRAGPCVPRQTRQAASGGLAGFSFGKAGDNRGVNSRTHPPHDAATLDSLTGGAFSAATSSDRAAKVRAWLATDPSADLMQEVYRELSARDKGAAKPIRERLEELKRQRDQDALSAEWAARAEALLAQPRMNIADALAWQRDAAKAGAPLSREPLADFKSRLAERVRGIEDLQHRVQVHREAALLLAQRIEVLSTRALTDALAARAALQGDVSQWLAVASQWPTETHWSSLDPKFAPQLEASRVQLQAVWDAFSAALSQAELALGDASAALPSVPVWAQDVRAARGEAQAPEPAPAVPAAVDPAARQHAVQAVRSALDALEKEVAEGHGKASVGAANALRQALKEHGRLIDARLESQSNAALAAATELEGWQRWSADKIRQELVAQAEALFEVVTTLAEPRAAAPVPSPEPVPESEAAPAAETTAVPAAETTAVPAAESAAQSAPESPAGSAPESAAEPAPAPATGKPAPVQRKPRYGGRKMQETLRQLRERWKQTDQSAPPNHALWKRFDRACNEAYKVVQAWLDQVKAQAEAHRAQRLALIAEVQAWAAEHSQPAQGDWKAVTRAIHQFSERWRAAGHMSEKAFAEIQPQWKAAIRAAAAPLEAAQKLSTERRQALIEEAKALGAAPVVRIDAVKALQQRWQAEAHAVPLDRKHEQKLWDAFRKPIDDMFQRKGAERERAAAALSDRDRRVLDASRALDEASRGSDATRIRAAMQALEAALAAQAKADAEASATTVSAGTPATEPPAADSAGQTAPSAASPAAPAARPLVARRGDDRPGVRRPDLAAPADSARGTRGGRDAGRAPAGRADRRDGRRPDERADRFADRPPRLGDVAFRAQRDAVDHAQAALRKLAAQAHGEALTQLMTAWEQRQGEAVPAAQELGRAVTASVRARWAQAVSAASSGDASEALLRLEMAAEVPSPAQALEARRALQLQLLTRRNDPSPRETWTEDAARVLATPFDAGGARRLQAVLKVLLRGV